METGFFKWLWRFNAIVIALAFLSVAMIVSWEFWRNVSRDRHISNVVNIDEQDTSLKEDFSYGQPAFSNDGETIVVPLEVSQNYDLSRGFSGYGASKDSYRNTVNYLIIKRNDGASRWLFEGHNRLITNNYSIKRPVDAEEDDKKIVARLYEIVTADSNDDKRLSSGDRKTLFMAPPDRSAPIEVLTDYDRLVSFGHSDNTSFEIIVETDDKYVLYKFSIQSQQQIGKIELPAAPTSR